MGDVEVHRLHLANVAIAGQYNPPDFTDTRIPVYAYLLPAPHAVILVDTGVGQDVPELNRRLQPEFFSLETALAEHGVSPEQVDIVINSHLHFDHCGQNRLFAQAKFFVQEAELRAAREGRYTVRDWFEFKGADIQSLSGPQEVTAGVEVVSTPGHTPGHQSVLVGNAAELQVVAAQATFSSDEFLRGGDAEVQAHEGLQVAYDRSLAVLRGKEASVYHFSHDLPLRR